MVEFVPRRKFMVSAGAALSATLLGLAPRSADAFLPLLLRGLLMGGVRAGAMGLAGRTALAGRGLIRPARPVYSSNQFGNVVQTGRLMFQAGRWINQYNRVSANYADDSEYYYDNDRYPQYFGAVPASLWIENQNYQNTLMPESDLYLSIDDGRVWQAYQLPELCIPPGIQEYDFALTGVPTGWGFSGVVESDYGDIESDFVAS